MAPNGWGVSFLSMKRDRASSRRSVRVAPLVEATAAAEVIAVAVIPDSIVNAPLKVGAVAVVVIAVVGAVVDIAAVGVVEIVADVATRGVEAAAGGDATTTSVATTTVASASVRPPRTTISRSRGAWMRMMINSLPVAS